MFTGFYVELEVPIPSLEIVLFKYKINNLSLFVILKRINSDHDYNKKLLCW